MTDWPTCKIFDCTGIQAKGFEFCLAHLPLDQFLATLKPGSDLDARGTTISTELFARLMDAVHERDVPRFGRLNLSAAELEVEKFGRLKANDINLDRARFTQCVYIAVSAVRMSCKATRFDQGVWLEGKAAVDFAEVRLGSTSVIFGDSIRLLSLREADVSNLTLADVDLRGCWFGSSYRLDQLRLEGNCLFNTPEGRWQTRRRMLYDEGMDSRELVAGLYRSLRKAFEDSKNEAGAGDFYYGEMEMRRRAWSTPFVERLIITAYWLLSGYGQRAGRAVAAIGVLVATVFVLLLTVGLPGEHVLSWARVDQSARIAMGAVVFREAGQQLTSAGNWTVMIARFLGPLLLILAALAVRARVKR